MRTYMAAADFLLTHIHYLMILSWKTLKQTNTWNVIWNFVTDDDVTCIMTSRFSQPARWWRTATTVPHKTFPSSSAGGAATLRPAWTSTGTVDTQTGGGNVRSTTLRCVLWSWDYVVSWWRHLVSWWFYVFLLASLGNLMMSRGKLMTSRGKLMTSRVKLMTSRGKLLRRKEERGSARSTVTFHQVVTTPLTHLLLRCLSYLPTPQGNRQLAY